MTAMSTRYPAAPMLGALTRGREHLSGADLHLAGLSATSLPGADLRGADLREARLRDSCLHAADLRDADLRDADLGGADLDAADLQGADLDGANLRAATFSPMTAWPPGFDPLAAGATPTRPSRRLTRSVFAAGGELHASWNEHRLAGMVGPTMLQVSATPLCPGEAQARANRWLLPRPVVG